MRWVKLIFPAPERPRKPLMIFRLTSSSLAGTSRKLVAVGTVRLRSMLAAIAAPAPRIGSPISSCAAAGRSGADAAPFVADTAGAVGTGAGAGGGAGAATVGL